MAQRLVEVWRRKADDLLWRAALSRDGGRVAFGCWDNVAYCYSRQGELVLSKESAGATSVGLTPDGSMLVSGSYDKSVLGLSDSGDELWTYTADHFVRDVSVHEGGVVVALWKGPVIALDLEGKERWQQGVEGNPVTLASSLDGSLVIVGLEEKRVVAFDDGGNVRWTYEAGGGIVRVGVSADGSRVAVGSTDTIVAVLDGIDGSLLWRYKTGSSIRGFALSAGAEYLLVGCHENFLYLFDRDGQLRWIHRTKGEIWSIATTDLADLIAVGTRDNEMVLLEHKEIILEQFENIQEQIESLRENGATVEELEQSLAAARAASTDGDRDALGQQLRELRGQLRSVHDSHYNGEVTAGLSQLENLRVDLPNRDTTLLEMMAEQAKQLMEKGDVARAAKIVDRAIALKDNLPPLLEDLTAGTKGTEDQEESDQATEEEDDAGFATVCDKCERPVRPDWHECPFCGHSLIA